MSFDNLMGYILSISIFHSVQEIAPLSLFQNLELGKALTDEKCHFTVFWLDLVNINVYTKVYQNIPLSSRDRAIITFFRIWSSAKPRPMKNVISQSLRLDLVSINVYAKVYQNIPLSSRDRAIFTFSEFGAWQSLD